MSSMTYLCVLLRDIKLLLPKESEFQLRLIDSSSVRKIQVDMDNYGFQPLQFDIPTINCSEPVDFAAITTSLPPDTKVWNAISKVDFPCLRGVTPALAAALCITDGRHRLTALINKFGVAPYFDHTAVLVQLTFFKAQLDAKRDSLVKSRNGAHVFECITDHLECLRKYGGRDVLDFTIKEIIGLHLELTEAMIKSLALIHINLFQRSRIAMNRLRDTQMFGTAVTLRDQNKFVAFVKTAGLPNLSETTRLMTFVFGSSAKEIYTAREDLQAFGIALISASCKAFPDRTPQERMLSSCNALQTALSFFDKQFKKIASARSEFVNMVIKTMGMEKKHEASFLEELKRVTTLHQDLLRNETIPLSILAGLESRKDVEHVVDVQDTSKGVEDEAATESETEPKDPARLHVAQDASAEAEDLEEVEVQDTSKEVEGESATKSESGTEADERSALPKARALPGAEGDLEPQAQDAIMENQPEDHAPPQDAQDSAEAESREEVEVQDTSKEVEGESATKTDTVTEAGEKGAESETNDITGAEGAQAQNAVTEDQPEDHAPPQDAQDASAEAESREVRDTSKGVEGESATKTDTGTEADEKAAESETNDITGAEGAQARDAVMEDQPEDHAPPQDAQDASAEAESREEVEVQDTSKEVEGESATKTDTGTEADEKGAESETNDITGAEGAKTGEEAPQKAVMKLIGDGEISQAAGVDKPTSSVAPHTKTVPVIIIDDSDDEGKDSAVEDLKHSGKSSQSRIEETNKGPKRRSARKRKPNLAYTPEKPIKKRKAPKRRVSDDEAAEQVQTEIGGLNETPYSQKVRCAMACLAFGTVLVDHCVHVSRRKNGDELYDNLPLPPRASGPYACVFVSSDHLDTACWSPIRQVQRSFRIRSIVVLFRESEVQTGFAYLRDLGFFLAKEYYLIDSLWNFGSKPRGLLAGLDFRYAHHEPVGTYVSRYDSSKSGAMASLISSIFEEHKSEIQHIFDMRDDDDVLVALVSELERTYFYKDTSRNVSTVLHAHAEILRKHVAKKCFCGGHEFLTAEQSEVVNQHSEKGGNQWQEIPQHKRPFRLSLSSSDQLLIPELVRHTRLAIKTTFGGTAVVKADSKDLCTSTFDHEGRPYHLGVYISKEGFDSLLQRKGDVDAILPRAALFDTVTVHQDMADALSNFELREIYVAGISNRIYSFMFDDDSIASSVNDDMEEACMLDVPSYVSYSYLSGLEEGGFLFLLKNVPIMLRVDTQELRKKKSKMLQCPNCKAYELFTNYGMHYVHYN